MFDYIDKIFNTSYWNARFKKSWLKVISSLKNFKFWCGLFKKDFTKYFLHNFTIQLSFTKIQNVSWEFEFKIGTFPFKKGRESRNSGMYRNATFIKVLRKSLCSFLRNFVWNSLYRESDDNLIKQFLYCLNLPKQYKGTAWVTLFHISKHLQSVEIIITNVIFRLSFSKKKKNKNKKLMWIWLYFIHSLFLHGTLFLHYNCCRWCIDGQFARNHLLAADYSPNYFLEELFVITS